MTASNDYWQQEQQSTPNRQKLANKLNRTRNVLDKDETITTNFIDHEEAKIEPTIVVQPSSCGILGAFSGDRLYSDKFTFSPGKFND